MAESYPKPLILYCKPKLMVVNQFIWFMIEVYLL